MRMLRIRRSPLRVAVVGCIAGEKPRSMPVADAHKRAQLVLRSRNHHEPKH